MSVKKAPDLRASIHIVLLIILTALVYSNTLENEYHLDSIYRVQNNTELDHLWPPWRFFLDRRTGSTIPQIAEYRPLMPLSHAINAALSRYFDINTLAGFHAGNIAIHITTSILIYLLFHRLLARWSRLDFSRPIMMNLSFTAALLFALHPVSGAAVNYVAGRDLLLMMMFLNASFLTYAGMRIDGDTFGGWFAVIGLLTLSLLSKANAIMAFAVIFLFEVLLAQTRLLDWRLWARVGAFGTITAGYFALRWVMAVSDGASNSLRTPSGFAYPITMLKAHIFYYLRNFAWPFEMRPLPQFDLAESIFDTGILVGGSIILATLVLAWYLRRRSPVAAFSILSYWVLFSLTSSVFPFQYIVTDYRQYPSLPYLALALSIALFTVFRFRMASLVSATLAVYSAAASFHMNTVWRTEESFWGQSVKYGGRSIAHMNFARSIASKDPDLAEKHFREALLINPNNVYANINLGMYYIKANRRQEGLAMVRHAVALRPKWAMVHYWLAQALVSMDREEEALAEFKRATDLDPKNLSYQYEVARALQIAGNPTASLPYLRRLVSIQPSYRDTLFLLGWAFQSSGQGRQAIETYRRFLSNDPTHVQTRFNLGFALKEADDCWAAVAQFERVLALEPKKIAAHVHLASCYRALGNDGKAATHQAIYDRNRQ